MNPNFLDFEQPIAELDAKIQELRKASAGQAVNIETEVNGLQEKLRARTVEIFKALTPWQISQLARHPQRPYTLDYLGRCSTDFAELHGDRTFADDAAIVGGLARLDGAPVMVIGQQKGRDTSKDLPQLRHAAPGGLSQGAALMNLAERSGCPSSPSSTRRARTRASTPRSAARPRPSPATCRRWRV